MTTKKYFLELPRHSELIDQDKAKYKNVVPWRYEQSHGRFLDRDRRSYREVDNLPVSKSAWAGIIFSSLVALIVFWVVVIAIWI